MVVWKPQPRQLVAMRCPAKETFFGGAKGGGKSDFLLGDWLSHMFRERELGIGILFRRTYRELEELIRRSKQIFPSIGGHYFEGSKVWKFDCGAALSMRYAENDKDAGSYQGHQYSWIGIDEVGNYGSPYFVDEMRSCMRSAKGAFCQMRLTGNPGGIGHGWLKRRFIDGKDTDRIYRVNQTITDPDGKVHDTEHTRAFVVSKVWDNLALLDNDPAYLAQLATLPPHLKRAYLDGDWSVFLGQIFSELNIETHLISARPFPSGWPRFATIDWGYAKPYSIGYWTVDPSMGRLYRMYERYGCAPGMEDSGLKQDPLVVGKLMAEDMMLMGITRAYCDPSMQQHHTSTTVFDLFRNAGVRLTPANRNRKDGLEALHTLAQHILDDGQPALLIVDNCKQWWRTMTSLTADKVHPEDIDTSCEDHAYDESRFAVLAPEVSGLISGHKRGMIQKYIEERDYARD